MNYLPNILTILRLISPFYFILVIFIFDNFSTQSIVLFYLFILLSLTDYLDGYIARRFYLTSNFGKVFDPISDKILTASALIFLTSNYSDILVPSILILFREFLISGVREYSLLTSSVNVKVSYLSKLKTLFQFLMISVFLLVDKISNEVSFNLLYICILGLWIVSLLTLYTGFQYCYYVYLKNKNGNKI